MSAPVTSTMVFIGEGAFALGCLDALVARGLRPALVASFDASLADASARLGLAHVGEREDVRAWLLSRGCDWLLCVRSPWIVPADTLATVRRLAIAFHDGPLPRYTGLPAASWAILHGEREYGVSWHELTPGRDDGRLLVQVPVPITATDTAFSLNIKCFEAGVAAFERVLDVIAGEPISLAPQVGMRSDFGPERPSAQCIIDWQCPAQAIVDLVRALDFGPAQNPLGLPKLWLGGRSFGIRKAIDTAMPSSASPGTLLACEADSLRVATRTTDVVLTAPRGLDDQPLTDPDLQAIFGPLIGRPLPSLAAPDRDAISTIDQRVARHEAEWIRRLAGGVAITQPPSVPMGPWGRLQPVALPQLDLALRELSSTLRSGRARAVLIAELAGLHGDDASDVGVVLPEIAGVSAALFAAIVPLRLPSPALALLGFEAALTQAWHDVRGLGSFALDLGPRTPALRGRPLLPARWPVALLEAGVPPAGLDGQVALLVCVSPDDGAVQLYAAEELPAEQHPLLDARLAGLVRAAADDASQSVEALRLGEHARLLAAWNATQQPYRDDACIHELFAEQVQRTPDAVAVVFAGSSLTYGELHARANRLAHHLRMLGVQPEVRVGICLERSLDLVVAIFAVLGAGGAYVPLDPSYPEARLRLMAEDAQVRVLLTDSALRIDWPASSIRLDLDQLGERLAVLRDDAPASLARPDDLAYVIYTSGSTGTPKGVAVAHRGVVNLLLDEIERLGLQPGTAVLQFSPIGFDASVSQLFGPLIRGARVFVATAEQRLSPPAMMQLMRDAAIAIADLPPSALPLLDPDQLPALRVLIVGGEPCPPALALRFARGRRFINAYGPTETTVTATFWEGTVTGGELPIGRPGANVRAYVLDEKLRPLPIGARGQLYIAGIGLARGYLDRPALSAERFLPDPFGPPGSRMYASGDACRFRADGQLEFLGRIDQQVKIRGFRIELGEIEAALVAHPGLRQCVVVARRDGGEEARLIAYLVGDPLSIADLRAQLAATLPDYMIPAAFVWLDTLPLMPSGKIDRQALPAPQLDRSALTTAFVAPRTPSEVRLAELWAELLGLDRVGIHDDFFELGGDSILAIRLASRALQAELPLSPLQLFQRPTIAGLAALLSGSREVKDSEPARGPQGQIERAHPGEQATGADGDASVPGEPRRHAWLRLDVDEATLARLRAQHPNLVAVYPATPTQAGMLFHALHDINSCQYLEQLPYELRGRVDEARFEAALRAVVARHQVLRTLLVWRDVPQPLQVVLAQVDLEFARVDLPATSNEETRAKLDGWLESDRTRPLPLERAPLLRFAWLRHAAERRHLVWTTHHVLGDGWSMTLMLDEVLALYTARSDDPPLSDPVPYARYVDWLAAQDPEPTRQFWRTRLDTLTTPTRLALPPVPDAIPGTSKRVFAIAPSLDGQLRRFLRARGLTLSSLIQTAWALIVGRLAERRDPCFGVVSSGRPASLAGAEQIVGPFVNSLPLTVEIDTATPLVDLLRSLQVEQARRREHDHIPLAELQGLAGLPGTALFDTLLVIQNYPARHQPAGLEFELIELPETMDDNYALVLAVLPGPPMQLLLSWDRARIPEAMITTIAAQLSDLLAAMIAKPDRPLAGFTRLTADSREGLRAWNSAITAPVSPIDIAERIAACAERQPQAIALTCSSEQLSYAELLQRSSQLAHALIGHGVGPDVRVGVLLDRSIELVIAELAVLAAGGAYVPLDPELPADRLRFIARDARLALVITRGGHSMAATLKRPLFELDRESVEIFPSTPPLRRPDPYNLAYVIYTSGSTGRPKGVAITRLSLHNLIEQLAHIQPFAPGRRALSYCAISFDGMVHETWAALVHGASLVIASPDERLDPPRVQALLAGVDTASLTPTLLSMLDPSLAPLDLCMVVAGEACPGTLARAWASRCTLINCYGPTEATVTASFARVDPGSDGPPPIGRPLGNVQLYVLDEELDPTPQGLVGELYIAGLGLARGYLDRPGLTAARFVPNPYAGPGERMYRSGDRCRLRGDGQLEFVGRVDHEIKLRGVRIDLGEIEATLHEHPLIAEAAALLASEGEPRLLAHVVAKIELGSLQTDHVEQWRTLNEQVYAAQDELVADTRDEFAGWKSSLTGEPIPRAEMLEWIDATIAELRELDHRRVLELGCGSGLVLRRLAPACEVYRGHDLADEALARIRRVQAEQRALAHVQLQQAGADDFSSITPASFDLVVINSVVQYFPDLDYLLRVIDGAITALAPGGTLYIGDVRQLDLLTALHAEIELTRARDEQRRSALAERIQHQARNETELLLAPALFHALSDRWPQIEWIELRTKRARAHNELSGYRYQALIHLRGAERLPAAPDVKWQRWASGLDLSRLREELASQRPPMLAIAEIPNARLARARRMLAWLAGDHDDQVGSLRSAPSDVGGVDPEHLHQLGEALGYRVALRSDGVDPTALEAVFVRRDCPRTPIPTRAEHPRGELTRYANQPAQEQLRRRLPALLREFLRERLPAAMIPAAIFVHHALPRTVNGKLDRQALASFDASDTRAQRTAATQPPRTEREAHLATIWAEVLGRESMDIHANFFELGGDSITSIRVVARAARAGLQLSSRQIFAHPTIAELAALLDAQAATVTPASTDLVVMPLVGELAPLSFAQARVWALGQREQFGSNMTNLGLRLRGRLDRQALLASLALLVERHAALRTIFIQHEGELRQRIMPAGWLTLSLEDLSALAPAARDALLDVRLQEQLAEIGQPLTRICVLTLGPDDHALLVQAHHALSDGWSIGVLLSELRRIYVGLATTGAPPLPSLPLSLAEYATWERRHFSGAELERRLALWRTRLQGVRVLNLPTDHPRPERLSARGDLLTLPRLDADGALETLARASATTLFNVLLAAWQLVLAQLSQQDDFVVGTIVANRERWQLENLVGCFVNLLPLRADLSGDPTFIELLARTKASTQAALAEQDMPFELIVDALGIVRESNRRPLVSVLFMLQNAPGNNEVSKRWTDELAVEDLGGPDRVSRFDLGLVLSKTPNGLRGHLRYSTELFQRATAERIAERVTTLLARIAADPTQPRSRLLAESESGARASRSL